MPAQSTSSPLFGLEILNVPSVPFRSKALLALPGRIAPDTARPANGRSAEAADDAAVQCRE
jgi:hypothetical protein